MSSASTMCLGLMLLFLKLSSSLAVPTQRLRPPALCNRQEVLCGSDQRTYENACQLRAARQRQNGEAKLTVAHIGPCKAKPLIVTPPQDVTGIAGSDVIFSCDVLSYPMAVIEWRKEGNSIFLPTDDSNVAVQAYGGPRRFQLTGWLQIQNIRQADQGVYTCIARSQFGEVSASARLQVLYKDSKLSHHLQPKTDLHNVSDDDEDDEDYESMSSGFPY